MIVTVLLFNLVVYSTVLLYSYCVTVSNRLIDTVWKVGRYWSDIGAIFRIMFAVFSLNRSDKTNLDIPRKKQKKKKKGGQLFPLTVWCMYDKNKYYF